MHDCCVLRANALERALASRRDDAADFILGDRGRGTHTVPDRVCSHRGTYCYSQLLLLLWCIAATGRTPHPVTAHHTAHRTPYCTALHAAVLTAVRLVRQDIAAHVMQLLQSSACYRARSRGRQALLQLLLLRMWLGIGTIALS